MPLPFDSDPTLDSLQDELRMNLSALNDLYHPVYPSDPKRIAELDRVVGELRKRIGERRRELGNQKSPRTEDAQQVGAAPQAKGPDRVGNQA